MAPRLFIEFLSKAICYSNLKTFHTCNLLSHWALSNYCNPLWDTFNIPMIKITYTSPLTCYTSTLEDSKHFHPSQNKTPNHSMTLSLSPKLPSRIWAIQKEIKDAYPKKVCHMPTRHVKKKRKKKIAHIQEK